MARISATPNTGKALRNFFRHRENIQSPSSFPGTEKITDQPFVFQVPGSVRCYRKFYNYPYVHSPGRVLHIVSQFTDWKRGGILTFADTDWYSYIC